MTPQDFIRKWKPVALTERATAQEHFLDLCRLFGHPTPAEDDPVGDHFTFFGTLFERHCPVASW